MAEDVDAAELEDSDDGLDVPELKEDSDDDDYDDHDLPTDEYDLEQPTAADAHHYEARQQEDQDDDEYDDLPDLEQPTAADAHHYEARQQEDQQRGYVHLSQHSHIVHTAHQHPFPQKYARAFHARFHVWEAYLLHHRHCGRAKFDYSQYCFVSWCEYIISRLCSLSVSLFSLCSLSDRSLFVLCSVIPRAGATYSFVSVQSPFAILSRSVL
jgi:hypothetical protein